MATRIMLCLLTFLFSATASAINVGTITTIIPADKQLIAKEIKNESSAGRVITLRSERIDSPMNDGKVIADDTPQGLLSSPSILMMPGNSKNIFKFWYQGKKDDRERYYRLTFTDEPVGDDESGESGKAAIAQAKAVISTLLVVQPRIKNLDYALVKDNVLNKGNVSFRIMAIGGCLDKKKTNCREIFYVMPGKSHGFSQVDIHSKGAHVGLWDIERFIPLQ